MLLMEHMENSTRKDQLLAILERAKKKQKEVKEKPKKPVITDVEKFIKEYGVESGSTPVPNSTIYFIYTTMWNVGKTKINRIEFFRIFAKYFHKQRIGKRRAYYLNKDSLGMTKELQRRAKAYDKQLLEKQKKERTKSRKQKIPLPTEGEES
jgi:hypothetical protein